MNRFMIESEYRRHKGLFLKRGATQNLLQAQ